MEALQQEQKQKQMRKLLKNAVETATETKTETETGMMGLSEPVVQIVLLTETERETEIGTGIGIELRGVKGVKENDQNLVEEVQFSPLSNLVEAACPILFCTLLSSSFLFCFAPVLGIVQIALMILYYC